MTKKIVTKNLHMECQSEEGITIALIDGMFATIDILCQRDLFHPDVQEALKDFFSNGQWRYLLRGVEELTVMPFVEVKPDTYRCSFNCGLDAPLGQQFCDQWATCALIYNDGTTVERCDTHALQESLPYWKRLLSRTMGR